MHKSTNMSCCKNINTACYKLHFSCLEKLIKKSNKYVNKINELGLTPLNVLLVSHCYKLTNENFYTHDLYKSLLLLLENGADPNIPLYRYQNYKNLHPLFIITDILLLLKFDIIYKLYSLLIKYKCNVNTFTSLCISNGINSKFTTHFIKYTPLFSIIFKYSSNLNFPIIEHHFPIVKLLINNGAKIDQNDSSLFKEHITFLNTSTHSIINIYNYIDELIKIKNNVFSLLKIWDKNKMPLEILSLDHFKDFPIEYCLNKYKKINNI